MSSVLVEEVRNAGYFTPKEIAQCEVMFCNLKKTGWPCEDI